MIWEWNDETKKFDEFEIGYDDTGELNSLIIDGEKQNLTPLDKEYKQQYKEYIIDILKKYKQ